MNPKRRREAEFHPERAAHDDGAKKENDKDGGAVTRIVLPQIQAARRAGVAHFKKAFEQWTPTAAWAAAA